MKNIIENFNFDQELIFLDLGNEGLDWDNAMNLKYKTQRLPNIKELTFLAEKHFTNFKFQGKWYWSASILNSHKGWDMAAFCIKENTEDKGYKEEAIFIKL